MLRSSRRRLSASCLELGRVAAGLQGRAVPVLCSVEAQREGLVDRDLRLVRRSTGVEERGLHQNRGQRPGQIRPPRARPSRVHGEQRRASQVVVGVAGRLRQLMSTSLPRSATSSARTSVIVAVVAVVVPLLSVVAAPPRLH